MSHSSLAKGVSLGPRSKETVDREWNSLATRLNAHGDGATKTGQRWKRYWADLKCKSRHRAAIRKQEAFKTGGGQGTLDHLSETDQKVLAIIGEGAVYGDTQHRVPAFPPQNGDMQHRVPAIPPQNDDMQHRVPAMESPTHLHSPTSRGHASRVYIPDATGQPQHLIVESPVSQCRAQSSTHVMEASVSTESPSSRGHTSRAALPITPRRILPVSPVTQRPCGSRTRTSSRIMRASVGTGSRVSPMWVAEIEERRVEAEGKLADAAVIAARAAGQQAEASLCVAQALHEQTKMLNKLFDLLSKK